MQRPKIQLSRIQLYADLIFFLVFFPLVITLVPIDKWLVYRPMFVLALTAYLLLLYLAYRRVNVPRLFLQKKWLKGAACIAIVLLCTWLFIEVFECQNHNADALSRTRNRMRVHSVWFDHDIGNPEMMIPPMLLITFVENAFKYGVSSDEESYISICMSQKTTALLFTVENKIVIHEHKDSEKTGIENCRRRLQLIYPDRHRLRITDTGEVFRVELEIGCMMGIRNQPDYEMYSNR